MRVNSSPRSSSARAIRCGVEDEAEADVLGQRRLDLVDDAPRRRRRTSRRAAPRSTRRRRSKSGSASSTMQPSASSVARALSSTAVTSGSTGSPPRSRLQAIRSPRGSPPKSGTNGSGDRERIARVGARERAAAAARRRAAVRAIGPSTGNGFHGIAGPGVRDPARRGAQADEVAERGRVADARAEVGPVGERQHPGRDRRRRAAARAARRAREVVGVARRAEDGVERLRAGAELRRVRLADHDRARGAQALDEQRVVRRARVSANSGEPYVVRIPAVSSRSLTAIGRPCRTPRGSPAVGRVGGAQRELGVEQRDDRVDARVDRRDPRRWASITSRAENSRARMPAASSVAVRPHTRAGLY